MRNWGRYPTAAGCAPVWIHLVLCWLAILLASCRCQENPAQTASPSVIIASFTPKPSSTPLATLVVLGATPTPVPAVTSTITDLPTPSPLPTLSPQGPYLMYRISTDQTIIIREINGLGKQVISLPVGGYIPDVQQALSPDGKWLAYYSGTQDWFKRGRPPLDLSLWLMHLPDGDTRLITPLFPASFHDQSEALPHYFIRGLDWSPDGRSLAFAGAMTGDQADIYTYEIASNTLRQITALSIDISRVDWSPDGGWIWFESYSPHEGGTYELTSLYVVRADQTGVLQAPDPVESELWIAGEGWGSQDFYYIRNTSEGCCGPNHFRVYNPKTQQRIVLWKSAAAAYAIDPIRNVLAVSNAVEIGEPGSFLVPVLGKTLNFSDQLFWHFIYHGREDSQFLGFTGKQIISISTDGSLRVVSEKQYQEASVSPDTNFFLLFKTDRAQLGMELFSGADQLVTTITTKDVRMVRWRPDSQGFIYITDRLYYFDIQSGASILIDTCVPEGCQYWVSRLNFLWLP